MTLLHNGAQRYPSSKPKFWPWLLPSPGLNPKLSVNLAELLASFDLETKIMA